MKTIKRRNLNAEKLQGIEIAIKIHHKLVGIEISELDERELDIIALVLSAS